MEVRTVIENGDAARLREMLLRDPSKANQLIRWGGTRPCLTHPLHYVSDMIFNGKLPEARGVPLVVCLIKAGGDLDFQREGKGDTPLIGSASLGAEDVGLTLLDAGANPNVRGLFGEVALHWAALLGEDRLAARLISGADLELRDEQYKSTPLGWAVHGWGDPPAGNKGRQREVVELLLANGAIAGPELFESAAVKNDPAILSALRTTSTRQ